MGFKNINLVFLYILFCNDFLTFASWVFYGVFLLFIRVFVTWFFVEEPDPVRLSLSFPLQNEYDARLRVDEYLLMAVKKGSSLKIYQK